MTKHDAALLRIAGEKPVTPEEEIIADILHSNLCHLNHHSTCRYFESDWNDLTIRLSYFLVKARAVLDLARGDVNKAVSILQTVFDEPYLKE